MPKETMTGRERWRAVLAGERPDRVPMDIWATAEAMDRLCRHLGKSPEEAMDFLHIDRPLGVDGRYAGPTLPADYDMWGVRHQRVAYGTGVYDEAVTHPLAEYTTVEDIEANYTWPEADWFRFDHLPAAVEGHEDRVVRGGGSEPFLQYTILRGDEQAFMDLLMYPDIAHYCLGKLFDLAYECTRRIYETIPGRVDFSYVAEDLGSQSSLMFSREQIHTFLFPGMKRMMDLAHENGASVFTHSDGAIRDIIPDLIDLGVDVLNPIQWRCPGMEREGLKRDFGDRLVFHGGVDNQQTLPFGTVEDVRQEVADNLATLGAGGGYIIAPCHNMQAVSPAENMVALYEAGYALGWT